MNRQDVKDEYHWVTRALEELERLDCRDGRLIEQYRKRSETLRAELLAPRELQTSPREPRWPIVRRALMLLLAGIVIGILAMVIVGLR